MASKTLTFSGIFISIADKQIEINSFKDKLTQAAYNTTFQGTFYTFYLSFVDDFLKIYFTHGRPTPLPEEVINTDTLQAEENPRQKNQYEPKQNFALIDFRTGILWLNNIKKKNPVLEFLKKELDEKNIVVKDVFNEAEFIEAIKSLDEIKFSAIPDLFSSTNTLTNEMANEIHGYEASVGTFYLRYESKNIGQTLRDKIKNLFTHRDNLRGIMISGRDAKGLGMLFNSNVFSKKIQFNSIVDENEIFNQDMVFATLINSAPAVYYARALYNYLYNVAGNYYSGCGGVLRESQQESSVKNVAPLALEYKLYPNPANNFVTLVGGKESERLNIKINDVSGKLLFEKDVITHGAKNTIDLDLKNGIYFVMITNAAQETNIKKLVISK